MNMNKPLSVSGLLWSEITLFHLKSLLPNITLLYQQYIKRRTVLSEYVHCFLSSYLSSERVAEVETGIYHSDHLAGIIAQHTDPTFYQLSHPEAVVQA